MCVCVWGGGGVEGHAYGEVAEGAGEGKVRTGCTIVGACWAEAAS